MRSRRPPAPVLVAMPGDVIAFLDPSWCGNTRTPLLPVLAVVASIGAIAVRYIAPLRSLARASHMAAGVSILSRYATLRCLRALRLHRDTPLPNPARSAQQRCATPPGPRRCVERPFAARHGKRRSAPKRHGDASAPCVASHACRPHPLHLEALTAGPLRHPRQRFAHLGHCLAPGSPWCTAASQAAPQCNRFISTGRFAVGPMTATTGSACCITCCCIGAMNALFGSDACCTTTNPVAMDAIRAIPAIEWCMTVKAMLQSAALSAAIYSVAPMLMLVP